MKLFSKVDRIYRLPRIWSNNELKKYAHLFRGDIINVSGWKDMDKEGRHYMDYFANSDSYTISNYKSEMRGYQGMENEIFLDLEQTLSKELANKYDVVFNHTTLEHVYDFHMAFHNICKLSKDIVILVVPFLQEMHGAYGDYWRFSPQALDKLYLNEDFKLLYISGNYHKNSSVYLFSIASRNPQNWEHIFDTKQIELNPTKHLGSNVYRKNFINAR